MVSRRNRAVCNVPGASSSANHFITCGVCFHTFIVSWYSCQPLCSITSSTATSVTLRLRSNTLRNLARSSAGGTSSGYSAQISGACLGQRGGNRHPANTYRAVESAVQRARAAPRMFQRGRHLRHARETRRDRCHAHSVVRRLTDGHLTVTAAGDQAVCHVHARGLKSARPTAP